MERLNVFLSIFLGAPILGGFVFFVAFWPMIFELPGIVYVINVWALACLVIVGLCE